MGSLDKEADRDAAFDLKNKFGKLRLEFFKIKKNFFAKSQVLSIQHGHHCLVRLRR